ncbi:Dyp-type peroxidase domain-containing protein [Bradyrhizobium sp. CCH5-F6]|jgi:porphyrinogen peroxidase|uniref:Dyp-type peroxidase n=1 Tax=Bradyrhizobium sp. CCH5-F6 TaxID=1768753 RepID=UPI00076A1A63|nr:Dyp-type peroxidase domain-containing protein [Bradyrhizobium sp. CCH5-F6]
MKAPRLSDQLGDIQGMLGSGYGWLKTSRFWLLTIKDGRENDARAWLSKLLDKRLVVSAADVRKSRTHRIDDAVAIAFTHLGLKRLGCEETDAHPFPTPFRSGMGSDLRALLLRDSPRQWRWSDTGGAGCSAVHVLVAEWRLRDRVANGLAEQEELNPDRDVFGIIKIDNDPYAFQQKKGDDREKLYEVFGFRDGLAQPVIQGLRDAGESGEFAKVKQDAAPFYDDRLVAPGEFILGYRNEYDELTYCPNAKDWPGDATYTGGRFALNGSYLAVRQIEQDVDAFNRFEQANGAEVCEKLMGRRKNGLPLSWKGDPGTPVSDSKADAFRFRVDDANGFGCPRGAHVRRVNPRDTLGTDVQSSIKSTKLHRLLRRGRPYWQKEGSDTRKGIFFIACNADLERQFEFIHQRWVRNPCFANLHADDPLVGADGAKSFSIPGLVSGEEVSVATFTCTRGGGYFFLPGLSALKFILERKTVAEVAFRFATSATAAP